MTDSTETGLAILTSAASGLPTPIKASFFKALSNLLGGLTAIPAAKLKQYAQGIEDTTIARSATAAIIAKAVADDAIRDPILLQAAAEIFVPTAVRKAKNRVSIAQNAAEHIAEAATDSAEAAPPEDDWMNSFIRFAEDASSERLQDLFGRILAGQVVRPGTFGLATLRAVSELDTAIAKDFSLAWAGSVGGALDYSQEWQRGEGFERWKRLSEAGLMAPSDIAQFLPPFTPIIGGEALWSPMQADEIVLLIHFQQNSTSRWSHIEFTRVGREIGSLLPRPDYEANMRKAAHRLPKHGISKIELCSTGKPSELIWQSAG